MFGRSTPDFASIAQSLLRTLFSHLLEVTHMRTSSSYSPSRSVATCCRQSDILPDPYRRVRQYQPEKPYVTAFARFISTQRFRHAWLREQVCATTPLPPWREFLKHSPVCRIAEHFSTICRLELHANVVDSHAKDFSYFVDMHADSPTYAATTPPPPWNIKNQRRLPT